MINLIMSFIKLPTADHVHKLWYLRQLALEVPLKKGRKLKSL